MNPGQSSSAGVLVLVGSAKPEARAQVERLTEAGALVLTLKREAVIDQDETALMAMRSGAAAAIKNGNWVVVRSENWPGAAEVLKRLAAKRGISADEVDRRVKTMLSSVGEGVVRATGAPVVVVGTETGEALVRQLGLHGLKAVAQTADGLPVLLAEETHSLYLFRAGGSGDAAALEAPVRQMADLKQRI